MKSAFHVLIVIIIFTVNAYAVDDDPVSLFLQGDYRKAYPGLLNKAAQGDMAAQYGLGVINTKGLGGVDKDLVKAVKWYRKSAGKGHKGAQKNLYKIYMSTEGNLIADRKTLKYYKASAKNGRAEAYYYIGEMYYAGYGVKRNYRKALAWYMKGARKGEPRAQYSLGVMNQRG